ncbi:MAG: hypothetical protein TE42_01710 [Candidatus Synechococcus spongiarum SP3]|uniref:Uncharacterized protein n=1 Tax=Candidatus Synechococcus spongiarum SP3 TaxID=1604020 RepID=A0A0G2IWY6_9SYNE|nr:MAG: hypothetical protein TE42_01710 [Candidatus Synechococcus spongiarum SP3]
MRNLVTLVVLLTLGAVCNFVVLPGLATNFRNVFAAPGLPMEQFFNEGPPTLFRVFWFCNVGAVLAWVYRTWQRRAASAARVARMRGYWWITASLLLAAGVVCSAFTIWIPFPQVSLMGEVLLLALLLVDEALFFWLPTVLASPRSYRLAAPGAQIFQKT